MSNDVRDEKAAARAELAGTAARSYESGHTLMEVAEELGVSYGKAHALVKESGATIRPRGARFVPPAGDSPAQDVPG